MNDETIFKIIITIALIGIVMLNQYSNYVEKNFIENPDENINYKIFDGRVEKVIETNNSMIFIVNMYQPIKIVAVKNYFYKNTSITENDSIIVEGDFTDLYKALNKTYFATQIIKR